MIKYNLCYCAMKLFKNNRKSPDNVFLAIGFMSVGVVLYSIFLHNNFVSAFLDNVNVGGDAGRAILDTFGGLGAGVGGQFIDADLGGIGACYVGGGVVKAGVFQGGAGG